MADKPSLRAALTEALGDEGTATAEATSPGVQTPTAEGAQSDVEPSGDSLVAEAQLEASSEGTADEPPVTYFGEDLSGFDASQRADIIGMLEKRDDFIGKLLREKATDDDTVAPEPEPEPEPLSDEQLLAQLGLDPENNPFDEATAKVALPLAKGLQQMQAMVQQLVETQELQAVEQTWMTALDTLEGEYGELPVDRLAVLEYAAANGIHDPAAAYWTIAGPAKKQLLDAVKSQQKRPTPPATTRPQSRGAQAPAPLEAKNVKDAVAEAARRAMSEAGLQF